MGLTPRLAIQRNCFAFFLSSNRMTQITCITIPCHSTKPCLYTTIQVSRSKCSKFFNQLIFINRTLRTNFITNITLQLFQIYFQEVHPMKLKRPSQSYLVHQMYWQINHYIKETWWENCLQLTKGFLQSHIARSPNLLPRSPFDIKKKKNEQRQIKE